MTKNEEKNEESKQKKEKNMKWVTKEILKNYL